MTDAPRVVLVVANETLTGDELIQTVRRRAEEGPIRVVVAAPVNEPRSGYVVYEDTRRAAAGIGAERGSTQDGRGIEAGQPRLIA